MPSIKVVNQATSTDALASLRFREIPGPALVSLAASCVTAGDTVSLTHGSRELLVNGEPNVESSADIVRATEDLIVKEEPVGAGILHLQVTATTAVNFLIMIENLPG